MIFAGYVRVMGRWRVRRRTTTIVIVLAVALVLTGVGVYVANHDSPRETTARPLPPPPDFQKAPSVAWTLDPAQLTGEQDSVLLSLPQTLDAYYGYGSLLDAPTALVGAFSEAQPSDSETKPIGDITLVGIDRIDGSALWKQPIGRVTTCDDDLDSGVITCWDGDRVVFVDTDTGALLSETRPGFDVGHSRVVNGAAFVSGLQKADTGNTLVLTGGTPRSPDSSFRRTLAVPGPLSTVDHVVPSENLFTVSTQTDRDTLYDTMVYDLATGIARFTIANDQLNVVGDGLFVVSRGTGNGTMGTQVLIDSEGKTILTAPVSVYTTTTWPTETPLVSPVFLGDGAYGPATGRELWRDRDLLAHPGDPVTAIRALAGRTVVVASAETQTLIGLDALSGQQLWRTPWTDAYWIYFGLTDGEFYVFTDYTGIHSLRVADGTVVWSVPLPTGTDPRRAYVTSAGGDILLTIGSQISFWRS